MFDITNILHYTIRYHNLFCSNVDNDPEITNDYNDNSICEPEQGITEEISEDRRTDLCSLSRNNSILTDIILTVIRTYYNFFLRKKRRYI